MMSWRPAERGDAIPFLLQSHWDVLMRYLGIQIYDSQTSGAHRGLDFKEINTYRVLMEPSSHDRTRDHLPASISCQGIQDPDTFQHIQVNAK